MLLYLILLLGSTAQARCLESWACWHAEKDETGVSFYFENLTEDVFTGTLKVRGTNLQSQGRTRQAVTRVMPAHSRVLVLRLNKIDARRKMSFRDVFYWLPGDMDAKHQDVAYAYPFPTKARHKIVQGFGGGYSHRGASRFAVDFAMPVGSAVHAARAGKVVQVVEHHNQGGPARSFAKYANYIIVLHADGTTGEYHHLAHHGSKVEVGDMIKVGQHIGYSGNTGFSSLPHLHFGVYRPLAEGNFESIKFRFVDQKPGEESQAWWQVDGGR